MVPCFKDIDHVIKVLEPEYKHLKDVLNTIVQLTNVSTKFRDMLGSDIVKEYKTSAKDYKEESFKDYMRLTDYESAVDVTLLRQAKDRLNETHQYSMEHLVVALYNHHPVRDDFGNVKMLYGNQPPPTDDDKNNYYHVKKNMLYLRDYKTAKSYGDKEIRLKPEVSKLIKEQIKRNGKRTWLVETNQGDRYADGRLSGFVKLAFEKSGVEFPKPITVNTIRHAFVSDAIENRTKKLNMDQRIELANRMLHSIQVATLIYPRRLKKKKPTD
jgi:hypothetical protein